MSESLGTCAYLAQWDQGVTAKETPKNPYKSMQAWYFLAKTSHMLTDVTSAVTGLLGTALARL
jgi:hypothetical protein